MKSNFYEKIISLKTEEKKNKIRQMDKFLEESIEVLIDLRKRQSDKIDIDKELNSFCKFNKLPLFETRDNINNNYNHLYAALLGNFYNPRYRFGLIQTNRRNMERESESSNIRPNSFLESID